MVQYTHIENVHILRSAYAYLKYLFSFGPLYYRLEDSCYKHIVWIGKNLNISLVSYFLSGLGFIQIPSEDLYFKFRIFFPSQESLHVIIKKLYNGYSIRAHIDIEEHKRALSNKLTFEILSSLSFFLRSECPKKRLFMKKLPYDDIFEESKETLPIPPSFPSEKKQSLTRPRIKKVVVRPTTRPKIKKEPIRAKVSEEPILEEKKVVIHPQKPLPIRMRPKAVPVYSKPVKKPKSRFFPYGKPSKSDSVKQTSLKPSTPSPPTDNKYLQELEGLVYGAMPRNPEKIIPSPKKVEKTQIPEKKRSKKRPVVKEELDYNYVQREIAKVIRRYGQQELENIKNHVESSISYQDARKILIYCYYGAIKNVDPRVTVICDVEFEDYLKHHFANEYNMIFHPETISDNPKRKKFRFRRS